MPCLLEVFSLRIQERQRAGLKRHFARARGVDVFLIPGGL